MLTIPELDFEVAGPTLGGRFTTIEGLLSNAGDHLKSVNPFGFGDGFSASGGKLKEFLDKLDKVLKKIKKICSYGRMVSHFRTHFIP